MRTGTWHRKCACYVYAIPGIHVTFGSCAPSCAWNINIEIQERVYHDLMRSATCDMIGEKNCLFTHILVNTVASRALVNEWIW